MDMLGHAKQVKVDKENTVIVEGMGKREDIQARINRSKHRSKKRLPIMIRKNFQERLAMLAGGVAVIRVGAATENGNEGSKACGSRNALAATRAAVERRYCSWRRYRPPF